MRKSGFLITERQYEMLYAVRRHGDPGFVYHCGEDAKWERTKRTLVDRGFIEDVRTIGEDGRTVVIPKGGPWRVTASGARALEEHIRRAGNTPGSC